MASPSISLTDIQSVLKQILQSQETCLQAMSTCVNTLSSINSNLSSFNYQQSLTQQPTYVSYKLFYLQQPLKPPLFPCHQVGLSSHQNQTPPPTFVPPQTAPLSFPTPTIHPSSINNTDNHTTQQQPSFSHKLFNHKQTLTLSTSPNHHQTLPITSVRTQELKTSIPMCNTSLSPHNSMHSHMNTIPSPDTVWVSHKPSTQQPNMSNGLNRSCPTPISSPEVPSPLLVQSLLPQVILPADADVNNEGTHNSPKSTPAVVVENVGGTAFSISEIAKSFCIVTTRTNLKSSEKKVVRVVEVTHQQQPHLTFELPVVPIHIFDPGGTLTVDVNTSVENSPPPKPVDMVWEKQRKGEAPQLTSPTRKFCIYVFDPGEGESQCRSPMVISVQSSRLPTMVSFPAKGSSLGAASGWPWVPWCRKHKVPKGCIEVFDPGGASFVFRRQFPVATVCLYCFKAGLESSSKWALCVRLLIGLCVFGYSWA